MCPQKLRLSQIFLIMWTLLTVAQLTYETLPSLLWNESSSAWQVGEDITVSRWGQQVSSKVIFLGITAGKSSHKFQQDYFIKKLEALEFSDLHLQLEQMLHDLLQICD